MCFKANVKLTSFVTDLYKREALKIYTTGEFAFIIGFQGQFLQ